MIDYTHYPYTADNKGWHMDDIHVDWINRLVNWVEPRSIAEIGCWKGRSAIAYVEAQRQGVFPTVHLIDIKITDELRELVSCAIDPTKFIFHEGPSDDFRMAVDLVVIDGDHNSTQAARDVSYAVGWRIPWIVLHDVSAWPKLSDCFGSFFEGNQLRRNPFYRCTWDDKDRGGLKTWRGLMIAGPERYSL